MIDKDAWICTRCKWEGHVTEIDKHRVFHATQEEPDEWLWYCPCCKATDGLEEKYENAAWCRTCEDVIVPDEGEQCHECYQEDCERQYDESRLH
jgi:hypothetical protein